VRLDAAPAGQPLESCAGPRGIEPSNDAPLFRSSPPEDGNTLGGAIRTLIERECAALEGEVEVQFERASEAILALTNPPFEFRITPSGRERLGLREFNVAIRGESGNGRPVRVACRVSLIKQVAVAQRPLNLGNFIRRDDLTYQQRKFDRETDLGFAKLEALVGQQVGVYVPPGEMVCAKDVKAVDLVKRGDDVTVVGGTGGVSLTLRGYALENGGYGETVKVQIGSSRKDRKVRRGVVTEFGKVKLLGE
jgi:flagella basal body P-ring formation protein FlgA